MRLQQQEIEQKCEGVIAGHMMQYEELRTLAAGHYARIGVLEGEKVDLQT